MDGALKGLLYKKQRKVNGVYKGKDGVYKQDRPVTLPPCFISSLHFSIELGIHFTVTVTEESESILAMLYYCSGHLLTSVSVPFGGRYS